MLQGIIPGEKPNAQNEYADIINIPHWEPNSKHPRMSLHDRAAQFAPFAALSGYDEMVDEEMRLTDNQIEIAEGQLDLLNQKLNRIKEILAGGTRPILTLTYFVPDPRKSGGKYATVTAQIRRMDSTAEELILLPKGNPDIPETISFDKILSIQGSAVDDLDDSY